MRIDWELLRRQKLRLIEILDAKPPSITLEQRESLDGIVFLIDAIQDDAVDTNKATEVEVFGEQEV
jgi:hypothetical protein